MTRGSARVQKHWCRICGYVYDPEIGDPDGGMPPGMPFEDLPDGWVCPQCGAPKRMFDPLEEDS